MNIPDLTHEQLQGFHALHYHPSNARFFTYGDLPLEAGPPFGHVTILCGVVCGELTI